MAALFVIITSIYRHPVLPIDDGYITVHDAQVLVHHGGHDPNYVGISPLSGETSLVHLALVALFIPIGAVWSSYVVSWLAVLAYVLGVIRLSRVLDVGRTVTILALAVALTTGVMGYQLLNGLETGLAMAAGVWLIALALERRHLIWFGLLCGIAPFVRPELGLLALLLLGVVSWQLLRASEGHRLYGLLGAAFAGAAPWVLWSGIATGHLLPTTVSAKAAWFAEQGLPVSAKVHNTRLALSHFAYQVGPLLLAVPALARFAVGRAALLFGLAFYAVYFYRYSSELNFYFDRYQYILIPALLLGLLWLGARTSTVWRQAGIGVAVASLLFSLVTFAGHWGDWTKSRTFTTTQLRSVALWANSRIPKASVVMVHDAGYISYGTDLHLVDLVGLKTPLAVKLNQHDIAAETDWAGRAMSLNSLARLTNPRYLIVLKGWDYDFGITRALSLEGWHLTLLRGVPRVDGYDVYAMSQ